MRLEGAGRTLWEKGHSISCTDVLLILFLLAPTALLPGAYVNRDIHDTLPKPCTQSTQCLSELSKRSPIQTQWSHHCGTAEMDIVTQAFHYHAPKWFLWPWFPLSIYLPTLAYLCSRGVFPTEPALVQATKYTVQSNPITTAQPRLNPSLEEEAWFPSWFPFWGRFPQRQASLTLLIMLLSLISVKDSNSLNILCSNYKNVSVFGLHPDSYKIFIMSDSGE